MSSTGRHVVTMENGEKVMVEGDAVEELLEDVVYEETVGEELGEEYIDVDMHDGRIINGERPVIGEPFQTYLPFRDGVPCLTLNLPDLMSRSITFENGVKIWICFSKKCLKQLALEGHLYNLSGVYAENGWTQWACATPSCGGSVSTGPGFSELRVRTGHDCHCSPDDLQVRLRINVYDLRLMAEFTDLALPDLYDAFVSKLQTEQPDCANIFPLFNVLHESLEIHRINKTYRKRFEAESLRERQRISQVPLEEFVELQNNPAHYVGFRRTRPFPVSICMGCNADFRSNELPAQDQLIEHVAVSHNRPLVIERYKFSDVILFEQWLRDFSIHSRQKLKRMGLCDEHMYYLCAHDDRLQKSSHTRLNQSLIHCTAFIRVHDWRIVSRREVQEVTVDYCLDHCFHDDMNPQGNKSNLVDYFSPEVFVRDQEERKARTQRLLSEHSQRHSGVLKRFTASSSEPTTTSPAAAPRPQKGGGSGVRALAPPIAAQLAGAAGSYGDTELSEDSWQSAQLHPPHVPTKSAASRKAAFPDLQTYNTVMQLEHNLDMLKERMQYCHNAETAHGYLLKIVSIFEDALADQNCAPKEKNPPKSSTRSNTGARRRADAGAESTSAQPSSPVKVEMQLQREGDEQAVANEKQAEERPAARRGRPPANTNASANAGSDSTTASSQTRRQAKSTTDQSATVLDEPPAKKAATSDTPTPRKTTRSKIDSSGSDADRVDKTAVAAAAEKTPSSSRAESPSSQASVTRSGRLRKPPPKFYE